MLEKKLFIAWSLLLVVKLIFSAWLPMSSDEAYYWVWSNNLQLSYYDHPAFVSWLFYLGHWLEPLGNAVRWPGVVMAHATLYIWLVLLKPVLSEKKLWAFFSLSIFLPLFGPGSVIITPDIPMMFFASALLLYVAKLPQKLTFWHWVGGGALLGFCFLGKYLAVLMVPVTFFYLYTENKWRPKQILGPIVATFSFFIFSLPVWYWNAQNEFISFGFQLNHGLGKTEWVPKDTALYILGQIMLVFPPIFYFALKGLKKTAPPLLKFVAFFPLIFFLMTSFRGRVEANWPILAHPACLALAIVATTKLRWVKITTLALAAIFVLIVTQSVKPWWPVDPKGLRTYELIKYDPYVEASKDLSPLFARTYQMASKLSYELKRPVHKLKGMTRLDFYDFHEDSIPREFPFFMTAKTHKNIPKWTQEDGYYRKSMEPIDEKYSIYVIDKR